jgi:AcrR family transcriptional regulator
MTTEAPSRKDEVLAGIVDYVFANGVSDLSLRPLAEALDTSPRMLLYHFRSKEELVVEVLAAARAQQYEMLGEWADRGAGLTEIIRRYWDWAASDHARPYMRLFFEVFGLAVQGRPGTEQVLPALSEQAAEFFGAAARRQAPPGADTGELVLLSLSTLRGLLFSLLATGDRAPLDGAMERFLVYLEHELTSAKE